MAGKTSPWRPIVPVPGDCPLPPPKSHPYRGEPEYRSLYYSLDGKALGWVYQFLDSSGDPVRMYCLWAEESATGDRKWHWLAFPEPRPLYGLLDLMAPPALPSGEALPVLVLPSEQMADQAREALQAAFPVEDGNLAIPCISWPGGSGSALKADWKPLRDRSVIIFPEYCCERQKLSKLEQEAGDSPESKSFLKLAHQPGYRAAGKIAEILAAQGCEAHLVGLPEPGAEKAGWGILEIIAQGVMGPDLWKWISLRLIRFFPAKMGTTKQVPAAIASAEGSSTPEPACAVPVECGEDAWAWRGQLVGGGGNPQPLTLNVKLFLENHPALKDMVFADEFGRQIVMRRPAPWVNEGGFECREWRQTDTHRLNAWLAQQARLICTSTKPVEEAIQWEADEHRYNPLQEYYTGLEWDRTGRMDHWLSKYMGVKPTLYTLAAGNMFLIGMIARAMKPGCILRTMPIFEGVQYRGKSTALRILGGKWFADSPFEMNTKDRYQCLWGIALYEFAELETLNRSEASAMKAFVSSPEDYFRAPYDKTFRKHPRVTVFSGTVNGNKYFKDSTGNTRYWPIETDRIGTINLDGLASDKDQLFAEAVFRYHSGERYWPTQEEQRELFTPEQELREIEEPWEEIFCKYLEDNPQLREVSMSELLCHALKIDPGKIDGAKSMTTRAGMAMSKLGWKSFRPMRKGRKESIYVKPGWTVDEKTGLVVAKQGNDQ